MYKIKADLSCGCFKRSALEKEIALDSREDALLKVKEMLDYMQNQFCNTHEFSFSEVGNDFILDAKMSS